MRCCTVFKAAKSVIEPTETIISSLPSIKSLDQISKEKTLFQQNSLKVTAIHLYDAACPYTLKKIFIFVVQNHLILLRQLKRLDIQKLPPQNYKIFKNQKKYLKKYTKTKYRKKNKFSQHQK